MHFIQNNSVVLGEYAIGGTRLWDFDFVKWPCVFVNRPDEKPAPKEVNLNWLQKVRKREITRLENSLKTLPKGHYKVVMTHFPPICEEGKENFITDMMTKYGVDLCVFGHIHSATGSPVGSDCTIGKTRYVLTSADWIDFVPKELT
jgi:predicted phosphohydrolase